MRQLEELDASELPHLRQYALRADTLTHPTCSSSSNLLDKDKTLHDQNLAQGYGEICLPHALAHKYPEAGREWGWQYIFPAR